MLREIAKLHTGAKVHNALIWFSRASDKLEQCRFACAIHTHDAPAFAAANHEVQTIINRTATIGLVDAFEADHIFARTRSRREIKGNSLAATWWLDPVDFLKLLHAALHLRGM